MRTKDNRLVDESLIPSSLWNPGEGALQLAPALARTYEAAILRHDLLGLAKSRDPKDPAVGGLSKEQAEKHFAQAFATSAARAQLTILDPRRELASTSDTCILVLAGGRVSLTDAPCGAGAASLSFLATIAELRARGILPRQPLDVALLGAELSDTARAYADEMLEELQSMLQEQAIFVEAKLLSWDATDDLSTTDLIKRMTELALTNPRRLLIVANFNAVLEKERRRKKAEPRLTELFRHASAAHSLAIWIEPSMNRATAQGGTFQWLRNLLQGAWRRFAREKTAEGEPILSTSARYYSPLLCTRLIDVRLALVPIDLARSN